MTTSRSGPVAERTTRTPVDAQAVRTSNGFVTLSSVPQGPSDKLFSSNCTLTVSCVAKTNLRFSAEKINFGVSIGGQSDPVAISKSASR